MAEFKSQTPKAVEPQVEKTSRFKSFIARHPRAAKVAGITAATAAVVGVVALVKNSKQDSSDQAGDSQVETDSSSPETSPVTEA